MINLTKRESFALALAARMAERFDFSTDKNFEDWATISFKAADAFIKKSETDNPVVYDESADKAIKGLNKGGKK